MTKQPLISIIIPDKFKPNLACEAIKSVYFQKSLSPKDSEIILVADDQNYPQELIRKGFPNVKILANSDKEGPGGARNTGLARAKGKFVAFLDSDDLWKPDFVITALRLFESDPQILGVLSLSHPFFSPGFPLLEKLKLLPFLLARDAVLFWSIVFNYLRLPINAFYLPQISHLIFKREVLRSFKFNYRYRRGGEDWSLFAYVLNQGPIKIIPQRLVKHRYSRGSSTTDPRNIQLKWESYENVNHDLPLSFRHGFIYLLFLLYIRGKVGRILFGYGAGRTGVNS